MHRNDYKHNYMAAGRLLILLGGLNMIFHLWIFKYTFLVNSGYDSTLALTILYMSQIFKNNECSDKVRFDYLEMHTNTLDLYLIAIVVWWVFDSKSVSLAIYPSVVAKVCIGKYREVQCKERIIDTHVLWIILIKTSIYLDWLEFGLAKFGVTWRYLSQLSACWHN